MSGMGTHDDRSPAAILAFWAEAGVDACLEDAPVDRFARAGAEEAAERAERERRGATPTATRTATPTADARAERAAPNRSSGPDAARNAPAGAPPAAPSVQRPRASRPEAQLNVPDEQAVADAAALARSAGTIEELRQAVEEFRGINLAFTAKNPCFADGNPQGPLMVIGEAPGRDEDIGGLPFVGRSGKLLDLILKAIGRDRTDTYISNVIYWRPPGNRKPTLHEVHVCQPFIERQIELAAPRALVLAGNTPTQTLLGTKEGITRMRGRWRDYTPPGGTRAIPAMPTLHPAFLLRQPQQKRHIWNDMLAVAERLRELEAGSLS